MDLQLALSKAGHIAKRNRTLGMSDIKRKFWFILDEAYRAF